MARILSQLRQVEGLSDDERALFAVSLAATPDERWNRMQAFLRSHWYGRPCAAKKSVKVLPVRRLYQSKKVVGRTKDLAHLPILEAFLACDRQLSKRQTVPPA